MEVDNLGEGDVDNTAAGQSLVFAILEVCLCMLVHKLPCLNPSTLHTTPTKINITSDADKRIVKLDDNDGKLIVMVLSCMESLPALCSPEGIIIHILTHF